MLGVQSSAKTARVPITAGVALVALFFAFGLNALAAAQVFEEYRMLTGWLDRTTPVTAREILDLRRDIAGRIVTRSVATAVVLLCTVSTLWLLHRQLAMRRALDEAALLAHDVLACLDEGVITTDPQSVVVRINPQAVRLLGVDPDCVGRPVGQISSAEVPLEEMSRVVTERKEEVRDRELTLDRDGRVRRLVAGALELKDTAGKTIGCVIHLRDVTERMLMVEQVWRMQQFASLSTLASGLHHEIGNPIAALSIHVQLLEERLGRTQSAAAVAELIGVLKAEVRRLTGILRNFRNFASLQRLQLKPVDIREVLEEIARLMRPQAERQGVSLELVSPGVPLPRVMLDREKFQQAVLNLVVNALEAMPGGGALSLHAARSDGSVRVAVRDTGPGIPAEVQGHIFDPYFSTKEHGTGIGLALADKLVRQHQGQLDFRTGPAGTTFAITLPVRDPRRSEATP